MSWKALNQIHYYHYIHFQCPLHFQRLDMCVCLLEYSIQVLRPQHQCTR